MRKIFVCGNWKMNTDLDAALALAEGLKSASADAAGIEVGACPPFVYLKPVADALKGSDVVLGGQNMYFEPEGAFTGEISAKMLLDVGCTHVILGHSERRHKFGEGDELINRKVRAALEAGLNVILCVGELLEEREAGKTEEVLRRQVTACLDGVAADSMDSVVLAYEPVWAIGTGKTATPEQAQEAHEFVRGLVAGMFDDGVAQKLRIQYGGSVKPENACDLIGRKDVDGALVGGASLKSDAFAQIISEAVRATS